ncbi:MAG TPA: tetratricopeptide repeat protein [Candidatus Baltobacteraceae bacterium]|nr:tetratricopeptide repeat protein [Candidatus Baltobacteraceae bacterium]
MDTVAVGQRAFTFVFTDIVGSTGLWERAPDATRQALARHDALIRAAVLESGGTVFKTVGDSCCCVFDRPEDAVRAALEVQRALDRERWPIEIGRLRVRIGIHTGDALAQDGDYFGPTLNRVARVMAAAHGGQILVSQATRSALAQTLKHECTLEDLGAHRLRDLSEPQHIFQVLAAGLDNVFRPPASLDARPNNLPSQLSEFIGRDLELDAVRDMLKSNRLVTISGPGGIGKTRLALQAAADTIGRYADGSWLVRLADIDDAELVPQVVASALHIEGVPGRALSGTIVEQLRDRAMFLVLDNAEHVLSQTAALVRSLLENCPKIVVIVTSREPLHVQGERVLRLGRMIGQEATHLFASRANMLKPDRYVEHICERLDGLPLAIEIAAGRIGTLSTKQLDQRLNSALPVLVSKDVSQESRHRTVRATIEWSYRLLNPKEQRFFGFLSVFEGGFTLDAAEAVCWAGEEDDPAFALLDALVEKSFVTAEPQGETVRYRLLDTLREFAAESLHGSKDERLARHLHFEHYRSLAERWGTWESPQEETAYLTALAAEIPNLRAALDWGFDGEGPSPACALLVKVALYWQQHCNIGEARTWFARACESSLEPGVLRAKMLRRAATFATIEDDYGAARDLTSQAMLMFREYGDRSGVAEALHNLAVIEDRSGSAQEAHRLYVQALQMFEETGHEIGTITALYNLAQTCKMESKFAQARAYLERGAALCEQPQHAGRLSSFWTLRGEIDMREGLLDEAATTLERALEMKRTLGDRHDEVEVLCSIAALELRRGNHAGALARASEGLRLARELDLPSLTIQCFESFAAVLSKLDKFDEARTVFACAAAMRAERGYVFTAGDVGAELSAFTGVPPASDASPARVRQLIEELMRY